MNSCIFNRKSALGAAAALLLSGVAQAQIDEIIVTANKREQTLQDIPVSVSVTTGDTIGKAAIQDIIDLQSVVPTLRVSQLQSSTNTSF
tara:strand:- start:588 stop:854 length:267 start_codon:yes stop_codon:yes gene_type:complete